MRWSSDSKDAVLLLILTLLGFGLLAGALLASMFFLAGRGLRTMLTAGWLVMQYGLHAGQSYCVQIFPKKRSAPLQISRTISDSNGLERQRSNES